MLGLQCFGPWWLLIGPSKLNWSDGRTFPGSTQFQSWRQAFNEYFRMLNSAWNYRSWGLRNHLVESLNRVDAPYIHHQVNGVPEAGCIRPWLHIVYNYPTFSFWRRWPLWIDTHVTPPLKSSPKLNTVLDRYTFFSLKPTRQVQRCNLILLGCPFHPSYSSRVQYPRCRSVKDGHSRSRS